MNFRCMYVTIADSEVGPNYKVIFKVIPSEWKNFKEDRLELKLELNILEKRLINGNGNWNEIWL